MSNPMNDKIYIIGGGLAGVEAAWQAVKSGTGAVIREMKPRRFSPAHRMEGLAELVCSNSLKSTSIENASGLLKEEMRALGSLVVRAAEETTVPAGGTLAVDRVAFSDFITTELQTHGVEVVREEVTSIPDERPLVIATGPLTSDTLAGEIQRLVGSERLFFYDAVAPIVYAESIDMTRAFKASRYDKGGADYINCPMTREEYDRFIDELTGADQTTSHFDEKIPYFEGCMPVEEMASRGRETLAFGPMKPVGLVDPATGERPHAVVQLRRENHEGTLYSMVGFQTRLRYPEQKRVFRMIPGLEAAEFARLGKLHRNTYINSPGVLEPTLQLSSDPGVLFAGQITGVEGYCESSVSGLLAGMNAVRILRGLHAVVPPPSTITGALQRHVSTPPEGAKGREFQPMNANFGLLPSIKARKKERRKLQAEAALKDIADWRNEVLEQGS